MKVRLKEWNFKKHVIISIIIVLILLTINFTLPYVLTLALKNTYIEIQEASDSAVGIIGGADGPTAIFLASKLFRMDNIIFNIYTGILGILLALYIPIRFIKGKLID